MTSTVLTPFTASQVIELGNKWRKLLLPIGEVAYKGRTLKFTRDYLGRLVHAFNDGAYDQVPLQLAGPDNGHTNAVEAYAGKIIGADVDSQGLWVTVEPTDRGQQLLEENPMLGVSARIVEDYSRADGAYYPAAIQHVLATHDPRIPGMGPWTAVEASNEPPGITIDLSRSDWAAGNVIDLSAYGVANATAWEIAQVDQTLAELAEYEAECADLGLSPEEAYADYPDPDEAELANEYRLAVGGVPNVLDDGRIVCPGCGTPNEPDARFCVDCGTSVEDPAGFRQPGTRDDPEDPGGLANVMTGIGLAADRGTALELARISRQDPQLYGMLVELDRDITLAQQQAGPREQLRRQQDAGTWPRTTGTEDRLAAAYARIQAGTYVPARQFAFSGTSQRDILLSQLRDRQGQFAADTDAGTACGALDDLGRCAEPNHALDCGSLAAIDPEGVDDYRDMLRLVAMIPPGENGDTMSDLLEQATGQRLSHDTDFSLFESGSPRREVRTAQRTMRYGDPDEPGRPAYGADDGTRAIVDLVLDQNAQLTGRPRTDRLAAIADRALRFPHAPRHPDYNGQETMVERRERISGRAGRIRRVEGTEALCGSLPGYSR